jgi:hypothetical protein
MRKRPATFAFLASFSIYLLPLLGPHGFSFVGDLFFQGLHRSDTSWISRDIAAALLFQVIAFALFFLVFRKPTLVGGLLLVVSTPVLFAAAQFIFLITIPSSILIENDTAPERGDWPVECSADGAWISPTPTPQRASTVSIPEVLIQDPQGKYAMMSTDRCTLEPLNLPQAVVQPGGRVDFMLGIDYVVPGAALLFNKLETGTGKQNWSILKKNETEAVPIDVPTKSGKILSADGDWIGWIEPVPDSPPPILEQIVIRNLEGTRPEVRIDLSPLGPAVYVLTNIDMNADEIMLSQNDALVRLGVDGKVHSTMPTPKDVAVQSNTFQRIGDGWIGWDAYRDQGSYRVRWSLPDGERTHQVLKGRSINSVAVTPAGDLIAISVATSLNIGNIQDAVYVLRASDGEEVFRRYLPRFSRTQVLFPDNDSFLYSSGAKTLRLRLVRE